jgi:hypothetical protein
MTAAAKKLPQYVCDFIASHPHRGEGLNNWLWNAALRLHKYMSDAEIINLLASIVAGEPLQHNEIERAVARSHGQDNRVHCAPPRPAPRPAQLVTPESAAAAVLEFLKGFPVDKAIGIREDELDKEGFFRCDEADYYHRSPCRPLDDWQKDSLMFLAVLYFGNEFVNVVTDHIEGKPVGAGRTMLRDDWLRQIREHGTPQSKAGAWFRFNPVTEGGSGKAGALCDSDVTAHRFSLLESDKLPLELQLSFFGKLRLPIAALYASGGKSIHCLVKMDCINADEYREQVARILKMLLPYGFDSANKNPSRLSRLAGASREIGAKSDGQQRLLYLNPEPVEGERIFP